MVRAWLRRVEAADVLLVGGVTATAAGVWEIAGWAFAVIVVGVVAVAVAAFAARNEGAL